MNIVLWDIETSLMQVETFTLYPERIPHTGIIRDWHIICAAWKNLNTGKVHTVSKMDDLQLFKKNPYDDLHVIKTLSDMLTDVDLLIAHNGDKFDIKMLNARLMFHGLDPLPPVRTLDTYKEIKKIARLSSNKLDYIGTFFDIGHKASTSTGLWSAATAGDVDAIKEMVKYNRQDVILLEQIYNRMLPYIKNHPKVDDQDRSCSNCGSKNLHKRGTYRNKRNAYPRFQCQACGAWSRGTQKENDTPKIVCV